MENGSLRDAEIGDQAQAGGPRKHGESLPRNKVGAGINAAICYLHAPPISRQVLLDLFDNRASFSAITAWRFGWRNPPLWASRLLTIKMQKRISEMKAAPIPERRGSPGERGTRHLAAWRERKARERDEKKKQK